MTKVFGITFAPLFIPLERRLQTLAVFYACSEFLFFGFVSILFLVNLLFTPLFFVPYLYGVWMIYDWNIQKRGGRLWKWVRSSSIWRYYTRYFPMRLHKTADLDPNENYVIGYHPHGIMGCGAFGNFATEATGFSKLFPGITSWVVTLQLNFYIPIHRDLVSIRGFIDASKESIDYALTRKGKGNAVVIVVGGAAESLDAVPNTMQLTLLNRKGFIKRAIINGAHLVPCISFGENEIFVQSKLSENSWIRIIQRKLTHIFRVAPPLFHGRGMLQYSMGYLPFRRPINTIVGAPIRVERDANPSDEYVDKIHAKYCKDLKALFDSHKRKYSPYPNLEMTLK